jgi:hypothetical protein
MADSLPNAVSGPDDPNPRQAPETQGEGQLGPSVRVH